MNFVTFQQAIATQFKTMSKNSLFRTDVSGDELWELYLNSFPPGSDPIFRERTHHNCQCCRQFIRTIGNVIAITEENHIMSLWDVNIEKKEPQYQIVANALSQRVKQGKVTNVFRHYERSVGMEKNFEEILGKVTTWNHFHVNIPTWFVYAKKDIPTKLGEYRTAVGVTLRGLREITDESVDTVLELIAQNSLYRGNEHLYVLEKFKEFKKRLSNFSDVMLERWVWNRVSKDRDIDVLRIRNTVVGTLLVDLSNDVDLETAVEEFEKKKDARNFKRPTALVSKKQVEQAKKVIEELGLLSALERRDAVLGDVPIEHIIFADRSVKKSINPTIFDNLMETVSENPHKRGKQTFEKIEQVPIEKFIADILPNVESVEVYFENTHINNLMSLIAPVDPTSCKLFNWDNLYSWSYNGEVADSIKERVKKAGGNVTGELCCRLAWYNYDDLDLSMLEPYAYRIFYGNKRKLSPNKGVLDVDANAFQEYTRTPAENIVYSHISTMRPGIYTLSVHSFSQREMINTGFDVEIDIKGHITSFHYSKPIRNGSRIDIATIEVNNNNEAVVHPLLPTNESSKEVWGLHTQTFHPVSLITLSPNFWGEHGKGNKHYFFFLKNCKNPETSRGFYNEFLRHDLIQHRKVLEMVGSKVRTEEGHSDQLSGLGFSETQRAELLVRVKGSFTRQLKITF